MKPLAQMSPAEKALLLHRLFPNEIRGLINYIDQTTKAIIDNPTQKESLGKNRMSSGSWLQLAKNIQELIKDHGEKWQKDSQLFALELFTRYSKNFMIACLQDYVNICTEFQFRLTIEAFFEV